MSQQMFEPQDNQEQKKPGWWVYEPSRRDRKTREMPKNEHPSTFEEPFPTSSSSGYQSQETVDSTIGNDAGEKIQYQAGYTGHTGHTGTTGNTGQRGFSPDGDAMESGYRPYNAYQPAGTIASSFVPPWARPQRNSVGRTLGMLLGIILVAALVLKVIIPLLIVLFAFAAIVIVIISVTLLVFGVFILCCLRLLGIRIPFRPARFLRRRRGHGGHRHRQHIHFDI
jgi:hypothetical protein